MSPRLFKEIRSLLPLVAVGAAALASCAALDDGPRLRLATGIYCLLCAVVGIGAMGFEMLNGMHLQMLTQPVARESFWRDKLLVQGAALLALGAIYGWVVRGIDVEFYTLPGIQDTMSLAAIAPLAAFGCGSALVLLVRHVQGAFWLLIGVGFGVQVVIEACWPIDYWEWRFHALIIGFSVLAAFGCWFGRKQFLTFQRYSALEGLVSVGSGNTRDGTVAQPTRIASSTLTLFRKEFSLQAINLLVFVAAFLAGFLLGDYQRHAGWALMKDFVCLLLPAFVGAASICEERRLGLHHWHITLPPKRISQLAVKVTACLGMALGLGLAIYAGLAWIAPDASTHGLLVDLPIGTYAAYAVVATLLGIFVSSVSRHYVQAAALACLLAAGLTILYPRVVDWVIGEYGAVGSEALLARIGLPVLVCFAPWQAYRNYGSIETSGTLMTRSIAYLLLTLGGVMVVTAVIYHRGWELLSPSKVGPATVAIEKVSSLFSHLNDGVTLDAYGRLWKVDWDDSDSRKGGPVIPKFTRFGTDDDWVKLMHTSYYGFGHGALKSDGTFWTFASSRNDPRLKQKFPEKFPAEPMNATPGFRWRDVCRMNAHWNGIRDDGTLWAWDANRNAGFGLTNRPEPRQIGKDNDWRQVLGVGWDPSLAIKNDGTVWEWGELWIHQNYGSEPRPNAAMASLKVRRARALWGIMIAEVMDGSVVAMRPEGFEWRWVEPITHLSQPLHAGGHDRGLEQVRVIDPGVNWTTLDRSWYGEILIPLKRGELWNYSGVRGAFGQPGVRIAGGTDWLLETQMSNIEWLGLKHDGSIWYWSHLNSVSSHYPFNFEGKPATPSKDLIIPRRFRPVKIGMLDERVLVPGN